MNHYLFSTIKKKINSMSDEKKSAIAFAIANSMTMGITAITTPIFTRLMSVSDYGLVSIYNSWQSVLLVLVTLMLSAGVYNNGLIDFKDKKDQFTSSLVGLSCLLTIVWFLIFWQGYDQFSKVIRIPFGLMCIMFLYFFTLPAYNFWMTQARFSNKYKKPIVISLSTSIVSIGIGILAIMLFPEQKAYAKIVGTTIPIIIVYAVILLFLIYKGRTVVKLAYWKYALSFNMPLVPHYLSNIILGSSDRIMIGLLCNERQAGIYGVVYMLANIMAILISSINVSWVPYLYKRLEEERYKEVENLSKKLILLVTGGCIVVMMFGNEAMYILAPKDYYEAVYIIPVLIYANFFVFLYGLFINVEMFYKRKYFITVATTLAALFNVAANYLLLPVLGYQVAAYTTLLGNCILAVGHGLFVKKIQKERIYDFKLIRNISVFLLVISGMYILLYKYLIVKYIVSVILVLIVLMKYKKTGGIIGALKGAEHE